jgi:hypothetical protein
MSADPNEAPCPACGRTLLVDATTAARLVGLSRRAFLDLLDRHPDIRRALRVDLSARAIRYDTRKLDAMVSDGTLKRCLGAARERQRQQRIDAARVKPRAPKQYRTFWPSTGRCMLVQPGDETTAPEAP